MKPRIIQFNQEEPSKTYYNPVKPNKSSQTLWNPVKPSKTQPPPEKNNQNQKETLKILLTAQKKKQIKPFETQ